MLAFLVKAAAYKTVYQVNTFLESDSKLQFKALRQSF